MPIGRPDVEEVRPRSNLGPVDVESLRRPWRVPELELSPVGQEAPVEKIMGERFPGAGPIAPASALEEEECSLSRPGGPGGRTIL